MNLEELKKYANWFSYELRKFFPEDERPVGTYVCSEEVVVLSNERLFIFYYDNIIRYKEGKLKDTTFSIENKTFDCEMVVGKRDFSLNFEDKEEFDKFKEYYYKYKE